MFESGSGNLRRLLRAAMPVTSPPPPPPPPPPTEPTF